MGGNFAAMWYLAMSEDIFVHHDLGGDTGIGGWRSGWWQVPHKAQESSLQHSIICSKMSIVSLLRNPMLYIGDPAFAE